MILQLQKEAYLFLTSYSYCIQKGTAMTTGFKPSIAPFRVKYAPHRKTVLFVTELFNYILGVLDQSRCCWHTIGLKSKNVKFDV